MGNLALTFYYGISPLTLQVSRLVSGYSGKYEAIAPQKLQWPLLEIVQMPVFRDG